MPFECKKCGLAPKHTMIKYVLGCGNMGACRGGIAIIGDSPSDFDLRSGVPFSSQNASANGDADLLARLCKESGLPFEKVFLTRLVKCGTSRDHFGNISALKKDEIDACSSWLDKELSMVQPKIIIAMGPVVVKRILRNAPATRHIIDPLDSSKCFPFSWSAPGGVNRSDVFKAFACPSFEQIRRNPDLYAQAFRCFKAVKDTLEGKKIEIVNPKYKTAFTEPEIFQLLTEVRGRIATEARLFFDLETSGFFWFQRKFSNFKSKVLCAALGFGPRDVYGLMLKTDDQRSGRNISLLREIMQYPIPKTAHNGKFDCHFLYSDLNIFVRRFDYDTLLAAWLLDQDGKGKLGLDKLSAVHCPEMGYYWENQEKWLHKEKGYQNSPDHELLDYCCRDVDVTSTIYEKTNEDLHKEGLREVFDTLTMPHAQQALAMETYGVVLDVEAAIALGKSNLAQAEAIKDKIYTQIGKHPEGLTPIECFQYGISDYKPFNINSPDQLADYLYKELKLPVKKLTDSKKPSTDEDALTELLPQAPFLKDVLEYKRLNKILVTVLGWRRFTNGMEGVDPDPESKALLPLVDDQGRIHTSYNIHGTATARISSGNPNLQNLGKEKSLRSLLRASEGRSFIDCDFSGLELRILGVLSGDEKLLTAFKEGTDLHSLTACGIFNLKMEDFKGVDFFDGSCKEWFPNMEALKKAHPTATTSQTFIRSNRKERKAAKIVNFAVLYGEQAASLASDIGVSKDEAQGYLDGWFATYATAAKWIQDLHNEVIKTGRFRYSMNRLRLLPQINSTNQGDRASVLRQAVNNKIQGTGADCLTSSILGIQRRLVESGLDAAAWIVMEIHDQVILDVDDAYLEPVKQIVLEEMRRPKFFLPQREGFSLEVSLEVGKTLGDMV